MNKFTTRDSREWENDKDGRHRERRNRWMNGKMRRRRKWETRKM